MKKIIISLALFIAITPINSALSATDEAKSGAEKITENPPKIEQQIEQQIGQPTDKQTEQLDEIKIEEKPDAVKQAVKDVQDNIFINNQEITATHEDDAVELKGYLEFDDVPEETIYLEDQGETEQNTIYIKEIGSKKTVNINTPKNIESKSLINEYKLKQQQQKINRLEAASKFSTQEYSVKGLSGSYSTKSGNLTFGTTYDSGLSSAQMNYSTGLFTRYDGKHFALTTAYARKTNSSYDSFSDKVFFAPELKITKRLSLMNVFETDPMQIKKQNEVILRYSPKIGKNEDVQLELGASQSFYNNQYINSAVRFSTRFKL